MDKAASRQDAVLPYSGLIASSYGRRHLDQFDPSQEESVFPISASRRFDRIVVGHIYSGYKR
jgi:hypothetical protein